MHADRRVRCHLQVTVLLLLLAVFSYYKFLLKASQFSGWLTKLKKADRMGRGVSSGGGQSSLGYLFGNGEATPPTVKPAPATPEPVEKPSEPVDISKQIPAGIKSDPANNYFRADGQNCGNFITDRPSTKVHAAPGGGSSLGYLFGGAGKN